MGHQKHRAREPVQRPGQGLLGRPVQVVGGLVQQEKVAGPQGEQAQLDPGLLAAAQRRHGLEGVLLPDAAPGQRPPGLLPVQGGKGAGHQLLRRPCSIRPGQGLGEIAQRRLLREAEAPGQRG